VRIDELRLLEAESVHIIREVVAELQRPVLLFSAVRIPSCCYGWRRRLFGRPLLNGLTGVDAPYEPPENPDLVLDPPAATSTNWWPGFSRC
jgi:Adenylylsulphate kinase